MADLWPEADVGEVIEPGAVILSFEAASAITKGKAVYLSADMKVSQCTATTQIPIGIATKTVAVGEFCPVCVRGVIKITAGGAINRGEQVTNDASANLVTLPEATVVGDVNDLIARALGMALQNFANGDTGLIYVDKA